MTVCIGLDHTTNCASGFLRTYSVISDDKYTGILVDVVPMLMYLKFALVREVVNVIDDVIDDAIRRLTLLIEGLRN